MSSIKKKLETGDLFMGITVMATIFFLLYMGFQFGVWLKG